MLYKDICQLSHYHDTIQIRFDICSGFECLGKLCLLYKENFEKVIFFTLSPVKERQKEEHSNSKVENKRQAFLMPHVEQDLLTLPEHLRSPLVFWGVRVVYSLVFYVVSCVLFFVCLFFSFLAMTLSVCFRFMSLTVPLVSFVPLLKILSNGKEKYLKVFLPIYI